MYLCYDVVRLILKIKYNNWLNLKRCLCGGDDYKECRIVECYDCELNYCLLQKNYYNWMWTCCSCGEIFCGKHKFHLTFNDEHYCLNCVRPHIYIKSSEDEIPSLKQQVSVIQESPEY